MDFLMNFAKLILYYGAMGGAAALIRMRLRIPDEVFRKMLHLIALGSIFVLTHVYRDWAQAALACLLFIAIAFPILSVLDRIPGFTSFLTERKSGELKRSLILAFLMFALVIAVLWGWIGEIYLVWAAVSAWGFGDAAAALVGTHYGRHLIGAGILKNDKSLEGTAAMFLTSTLAVWLILWQAGGLPLGSALLAAALTALVTAFVELISPGGIDTLSCPLAAALVLILLRNAGGILP